jgi:prepilin-type N-terminal cleavage/methylation domain-containing protein
MERRFYKNKKGFTLVELIMTISILGILALVVIPEDHGLAPISLDAAALQVRSDIRYAQNLATTTSESYGFRTTSDTAYEVYRVSDDSIATSAFNTPLQMDLSDSYGEAVFSSDSYQIEFDSTGTPQVGGGTIVQINDDLLFKRIQVTNTTGYVSLL